MFANVVVGVPPDDEVGKDVIVLAGQLLAQGGRLTLIRVLVATDKPAPDAGAAHAAAKRRQAVAELTDLAQQCAISAQAAYREAPSVRRGLHEFVSAHEADLLVVGASRSDEVVQLLLGDDTLEVLEDAPCAVAVAPTGYAARAATIHRIGVAYDGTAESQRALTVARSLARDQGANLSAIRAVPAPLHAHDVWDVRGELDQDVEEVRQQIAALGDVEAVVEFGEPADELARFAQSVDLLIIGSHKYRPIDHLLQQTTSQQLAGRTSSPLLILSSNGRARG